MPGRVNWHAMARSGTAILALILIVACADPGTQTSPVSSAVQQKRPDAPQLAPYVPTPQVVVDEMLKVANVSGNFAVEAGFLAARVEFMGAGKPCFVLFHFKHLTAIEIAVKGERHIGLTLWLCAPQSASKSPTPAMRAFSW